MAKKLPPRTFLPVLTKLKDAYLLWFAFHPTIPKAHRFTLAAKIDNLLVETMEAIAVASFTPRPDKLPHVRLAIRKIDTFKVMLLILWETKSIDNKKYINLSQKIDEVGRMLGGWHGQLTKQNSIGINPMELS
jgi:hypothetical protein